MLDYYKVLGLQKSASRDDVRKSYYKLARKWHPDKNPSNKEEAEKKFKAVVEAYEVLSDPQKRLLYDRSVKESKSYRGSSATEGHDNFFDFPFVFYNLEMNFMEIFGMMDLFGPVFWNPFYTVRNNSENCHKTSGRGGRSRSSSYFTDSFTPWNSYSPSEQHTFYSAKNTAGPSVITTTEVINGKRITTRKIIENGQKITEVEKDGKPSFVTVNGRRRRYN
ncbi:DNJB8 protein, partial [Lophotis ruficrista]|nr:DNJB8 protein [Lophotis ruficrista]